MKRVLHVMHSLERSGMETMLLCSYDEWTRLGFHCDVLATADTIGPVAEQMRASGYGLCHIPFRSGQSYLPRAEFVREFYALCRTGYDVVHVHTEIAPPVVAVLAKLAGVERIAVTPHNVFQFSGALRARKYCERALVRLLGGIYGMISEGVVACEWDRYRNRGVRIWNWIDTAHFRPPTGEERAVARETLGIRNDQFVTLSVGNCNYAKNHGAILRAMTMLPASLNLLHLHVGREEVGYPERRLAAELGIENGVRFLGSQVDPLPSLWAADAFLMPSHNEGLGLSAIEAVATGLLLACSDVQGLKDVAAETKWTILTSPSADSVAEAIMRLTAMPATQRHQNALEDSCRIRERFAVESGVRSITDGLYREDIHAAKLQQQEWMAS
jgi:glycosyltransferase involved in cell wall biosynthesis